MPHIVDISCSSAKAKKHLKELGIFGIVRRLKYYTEISRIIFTTDEDLNLFRISTTKHYTYEGEIEPF